jgi:hypothetical protein
LSTDERGRNEVGAEAGGKGHAILKWSFVQRINDWCTRVRSQKKHDRKANARRALTRNLEGALQLQWSSKKGQALVRLPFLLWKDGQITDQEATAFGGLTTTAAS